MHGQQIANPRITVHPDGNWVAGWEWTPGNTLTLYVDNDTNLGNGSLYTVSQTVDGNGSVWFNVDPAIFDLVPDQYITLDDGVSTKSTRIQEIHFEFDQ